MNKNFSLLAVLALIAAVAMGQSSLKDTKTQLAASADVIPVGTVMAYVGASAPTGWLLAQGQCVSQTTYAALYAVTSALPYQTGCGGGLFKLPPMNGRYLRGAGAPTDGQGGDTVVLGTFATNKTRKNGLTASAGSSAVSVSGNKNQFNTNQTSNIIVRLNASGWGTNAVAITNATGTQSTETALTSTTWTGTFSATGTAAAQSITIGNGDSETTPASLSLNYIIKVA